MQQVLKPLSLYKLSDDTLIHAELLTYSIEFDTLINSLNELERECFISTATDFGLSLREKIFGPIRLDLTQSSRREMLLYRGAITSNDFNLEAMAKSLVSVGIKGYIIEKPSLYQIHINCLELLDDSRSQAQVEIEAKKFLPAHLEAIFDFRPLQWVQIDAMDKTCLEMDNKDYTWAQIDSNDFTLDT